MGSATQDQHRSFSSRSRWVLLFLSFLLLLSLFTWYESPGVIWPFNALALLIALAAAGWLGWLAINGGNRRFVWSVGLLFFVCSGALLLQPKIEWDGAAYYAQARSIAFDGDLDFENEGRIMPSLVPLTRQTPRERVGLPFSFGPAVAWLTWMPFARVLGAGATGLEVPYLFGVMFTSALMGLLGILLVSLAVKEVFPGEAGASALVFLLVLSSALPIYLWFQPAYSHAYQFAAQALALWWFVRLITIARKQLTVGTTTLCVLSLITGLVIGLNFLMRWQGALVAIVFVVPAWELIKRNPKLLPLSALFCITGFLLCWIPQAFVIGKTWGSFLTLPRIEENFIDLTRPQIFPLLFSTWNGMFFYHPVLISGILGGLFLLRCKQWRLPVAAVLVWMLVETYVVSCTRDWHGGGSFGQRRLLGFVPWLAFFLVLWFAIMRRPVGRRILAVALVVLAILNLLHAGAFAHYRVPPSPADPTNYVHTKRQKIYALYNYGPALGDIARGSAYFIEETMMPAAESKSDSDEDTADE